VHGLTVVIPTYNCKALLARTLDSIRRQTLDGRLFEVIVVDDGSTDGTAEMVSAYQKNADLSIQYFYQEDKGFRVATARNAGIKRARFDVIFFIDAGIIVSSDLLSTHLQMHRDKSPLVVIGTSYGVHDYETRSERLINSIADDDVDRALSHLGRHEEVFDSRTCYLQSIDYDLSRMSAPWLIFWGGHVSVTTALLHQAGGFDEWFTQWGGEDNELGLRLFLMGCEFLALREVKSIHLPHPRDAGAKKRSAMHNVRYIHEKHGLPETGLLVHHNWQCIVSSESEPEHCAQFGCIGHGLKASQLELCVADANDW
jgi:glycosyltransferase involved in cell wall biosynthesis